MLSYVANALVIFTSCLSIARSEIRVEVMQAKPCSTPSSPCDTGPSQSQVLKWTTIRLESYRGSCSLGLQARGSIIDAYHHLRFVSPPNNERTLRKRAFIRIRLTIDTSQHDSGIYATLQVMHPAIFSPHDSCRWAIHFPTRVHRNLQG